MHQGHASGICIRDMKQEHASGTCIRDMHRGHEAGTCSKDSSPRPRTPFLSQSPVAGTEGYPRYKLHELSWFEFEWRQSDPIFFNVASWALLLQTVPTTKSQDSSCVLSLQRASLIYGVHTKGPVPTSCPCYASFKVPRPLYLILTWTCSNLIQKHRM